MHLQHPAIPHPILVTRRRGIRRVSLSVGTSIRITAPLRTPLFFLKLFLQKQLPWLEAALAKRAIRAPHTIKGDAADYRARRKNALAFVTRRITELNTDRRFVYQRLSIRNTASRWGSCSARGTLTFHYRILDLPQELQDYLLIHELCHLVEPNHSPRFWARVALLIPDWKHCRRALRAIILP